MTQTKRSETEIYLAREPIVISVGVSIKRGNPGIFFLLFSPHTNNLSSLVITMVLDFEDQDVDIFETGGSSSSYSGCPLGRDVKKTYPLQIFI